MRTFALQVRQLPIELGGQVARRQRNVVFPLKSLAKRLGHLHFAFRLVVIAAGNREWPILADRPIVNSGAFAVAKEMVRAEGLEPPRLSPPEPKSGASTSSATPAASAGLTRPICFWRSISACPLCAIKKYRADALDGSFAHHRCYGDRKEAGRDENSGCAVGIPGKKSGANRRRPNATEMAAKPMDVATLRMNRPFSPHIIHQHSRRHAQRAKMGQMAWIVSRGAATLGAWARRTQRLGALQLRTAADWAQLALARAKRRRLTNRTPRGRSRPRLQ